MNGMLKVLVVDNGAREPDDALSAELAGLGYASVTAPLEAADDVLALMPSPAAVILRMSRHASWAERHRFFELSQRLRRTLAPSGTPVLMAEDAGDIRAKLRDELALAVIPPRPAEPYSAIKPNTLSSVAP